MQNDYVLLIFIFRFIFIAKNVDHITRVREKTFFLCFHVLVYILLHSAYNLKCIYASAPEEITWAVNSDYVVITMVML